MGRTKRLPADFAGQTAAESAPETAGPRVNPLDDVAEGETRSLLLFQDMQPNDIVRVARENDTTKDREPHGSLNFDQSTVEYLMQLFGGGCYKLQLIRRNHTGKPVIVQGLTLNIPGPYKPPTGPLPGGPAVYTEPASEASARVRTDTTNMSPRELLDYAAFSRMMEVMKQPVAAPSPTSSMLRDMAPILTPIAAAIGTVMIERLTKPAKPDDTIARQLDAFAAQLREMQNKPGPAAAGMDELIGVFERMQKIRSAIAGGGDGGETGGEGGMWGNVLRMGMEMLQRGQQGTPAPAPIAAPRALVAGADPEPVDVAALPLWRQMLHEYAPMIVDAAQTNKPADLAAGLVAEWCPAPYRGALVELAQQPNTETLLVEAIPPLGQFPTWVAEFVAECRAVLFGDEDEEPEPAAGGDVKPGGAS